MREKAVVMCPIFFIGMPRSGTTVCFEAFSTHEELAWPSSYIARYPTLTIVEVVRRFTDNRIFHGRGKKNQLGDVGLLNKFLPKPSEAYAFWEQHCGEKFRRTYLLGTRASEKERDRVRSVVARIVGLQGRTRFCAKLTGPPRMTYLRSIFSDALFVHVVRDGRAVVNSLLHVDFWREGGGLERPWWRDGLTQQDHEEWQGWGGSPVALAAIQWRRVIEVTEIERGAVPSDRFMEIRYEDFVDRPRQVLGEVFQFCGLRPSLLAERYLDRRSNLKNMNYKYRQMEEGDIHMMESIMGATLRKKGYSI